MGWWLASRPLEVPKGGGSGRAGALVSRPASQCWWWCRSRAITAATSLTAPRFWGEYAPSFLRSLIGAAPRRPPLTSVAAADPYLDVVQPLLEQRCGTCHNADKREGGFSVGSYDSTLVGGDTGRAFVPGNIEASEALYRTSLPPDDEAFMPAEGKTPLTTEQVEILRWWVGAGALRDTTVGAIGAPGNVEPLLPRNSGSAAQRRRLRPLIAAQRPIRSSSPTCSQRGFRAAGLSERRSSRRQRELAGHDLGAAALAALKAAAPEIVDLNLADTALDDAGLAAIGALAAATHLRLARNRLTDSGLAPLAALPQLTHLNLYGNGAVTDSGLALLTASGFAARALRVADQCVGRRVAQLRQQRPELIVDFGAEPQPPRVEPRRRAQRRSGEMSESDSRRKNFQRPFSRMN